LLILIVVAHVLMSDGGACAPEVTAVNLLDSLWVSVSTAERLTSGAMFAFAVLAGACLALQTWVLSLGGLPRAAVCFGSAFRRNTWLVLGRLSLSI
jgi:hypothetical protein